MSHPADWPSLLKEYRYPVPFCDNDTFASAAEDRVGNSDASVGPQPAGPEIAVRGTCHNCTRARAGSLGLRSTVRWELERRRRRRPRAAHLRQWRGDPGRVRNSVAGAMVRVKVAVDTDLVQDVLTISVPPASLVRDLVGQIHERYHLWHSFTIHEFELRSPTGELVGEPDLEVSKLVGKSTPQEVFKVTGLALGQLCCRF